MSSMQSGLQAINAEPSNRAVIDNFVRFFIATATIPIIVYFLIFGLLKYVLQPNLFPKSLSPPIISGIAAVLALNIVTASFALLAVREQSPPPVTSSIGDSEITPQVESEEEIQEESEQSEEPEEHQLTEEEKKDQ